jgi:hypothetical protein
MDKLLLGFAFQHPGQLPASRDVMLSLTPGEGQMLLDPLTPPDIGTVEEGRLVIASESFPRFAPLTLTLAGADLRFTVRSGKVLKAALRHRGDEMLRLYCNDIWQAAYRHQITWVFADRVTLSRFNSMDGDRETALEVRVLAGSVVPSVDLEKSNPGGVVGQGWLELRRGAGGQLKLQMHGARLELSIHKGVLVGLRAFDSKGEVAAVHLLNLSGGGLGASVSVVDAMP